MKTGFAQTYSERKPVLRKQAFSESKQILHLCKQQFICFALVFCRVLLIYKLICFRFIDEYGYVEQVLFDQTVNASSMNVFYQVPQYILQGAGEALVSVTGLYSHLFNRLQRTPSYV
jgi:hypothetical protein